MEITDSTLNLMMYGLFGLIGAVIGLLIGAALGMVVLRLAAKWLGFGEVSSLKAFTSSLIANFVTLIVNFSVGFNYGSSMKLYGQMSEREFAPRGYSMSMAQMMSPMFILYATALGLLMTAAIFYCTLRKTNEESPPRFGECFALSSFYYAMSFTVWAIFLFVAYSLVVLFYALMEAGV